MIEIIAIALIFKCGKVNLWVNVGFLEKLTFKKILHGNPNQDIDWDTRYLHGMKRLYCYKRRDSKRAEFMNRFYLVNIQLTSGWYYMVICLLIIPVTIIT